MEQVSSVRSALGSLQNRLEHSIANNENVVENTQSAEIRIRDTDMAKEMVSYAKQSILEQVAQAMMAQTRNNSSVVLQLLQ